MEVKEISKQSAAGDQSDLKQVLIEKDGKFELVNASDMQALGTRFPGLDDESSGIATDQANTTSNDEQTAAIEPSEDVTQTSNQDAMTLAKESGIQPPMDNINNDDNNSNIILPQPCAMEDQCNLGNKALPDDAHEKVKNVSSDSAEVAKQFRSSSQVSFALKEKKVTSLLVSSHTKSTLEDRSSFKTLSATTLHRNNGHKQQLLLVSRTKSAPGFRNSPRLHQEEDVQRRERNEAAFRAWLSRKNKELAQLSVSESLRVKKSKEEIREKQRRNELTFKAWLENKKQEYFVHRTDEIIQPAISLNKITEKRRIAFESWLIRKQVLRKQEESVKQRSHQLQEEAAKKADPTTVSQAYKSWLHRKRVQAKEEEMKKEQYRKMYFRQSQTLKQTSANLRFEGF